MQTLKLGFLLGWLAIFSCAQKPAKVSNKTEWLTLEQVAENMKKEKRPILVDLYTDWCGWCKVMDRKTYANKNVADYLGKKFYAVKVDAESRKAISWNGRSFPFNQQYRTNEFAIYLTNGQLSYPTTVIIPADGSAPQAIPGFYEPKDFELIVKYFGEGYYGKTPFDQYQKSFKASW
jgi:thioredoxin-related protein